MFYRLNNKRLRVINYYIHKKKQKYSFEINFIITTIEQKIRITVLQLNFNDCRRKFKVTEAKFRVIFL